MLLFLEENLDEVKMEADLGSFFYSGRCQEEGGRSGDLHQARREFWYTPILIH